MWQSRNFLKTNTPRADRFGFQPGVSRLNSQPIQPETCHNQRTPTPPPAERYRTTHRSSEPRRQIADDLRAPPCPTQPGRGPAHLSNHPPAHTSPTTTTCAPHPCTPFGELLGRRDHSPPPPLPVSMHVCVLPYRRARALGAVFARQSGPRARALTKGRASFAL